jgi:hypothetical protein
MQNGANSDREIEFQGPMSAIFRRGRTALLLLSGLSLSVIASGQNAPPTAQVPGSVPAPKSAAVTDDNWHFAMTPYLWFAGLHGEAGVDGHISSVHASAGDLLSHLKIGLMAEMEARKRRFLVGNDLVWMRLSDDKGLPTTDGIVQSIKAGIHEFVLTPKVGYRVVDSPKVKVDALVGVRYWHMSENLEFQPQIFSGISRSQNWADVVAGGRILMPVSSKATITLAGDAGGGGADHDYQLAALLGYQVGKKTVLQAGYRYLDVNYRNSQSFVYDAISSGLIMGVTFNLK